MLPNALGLDRIRVNQIMACLDFTMWLLKKYKAVNLNNWRSDLFMESINQVKWNQT